MIWDGHLDSFVYVCSSPSRVLSTWCHLYFLSLPDTTIWASVCSSSLHLSVSLPISLTDRQTHTQSHTHTRFTTGPWQYSDLHHLSEGVWIGIRRNRTHILYHPAPAWEKIISSVVPLRFYVCVCECVWRTLFPVFPNDQCITPPVISLAASQGIWLIHNTSMGRSPPSVCLSVCLSVWAVCLTARA